MFLGTANQATEDMGSSAKELTKPMISRQGMGIDIRQIADAEKADYLSRTLKHLTGVPAYHVYMMDPETFDRNPEQLAETLMYFRTVGLTPEEKKKIPQEELFNIRHIDRTIKVATQYGALLSEAENIITKAAKDETLPERYTSYLEIRQSLTCVMCSSFISTPRLTSRAASRPAPDFLQARPRRQAADAGRGGVGAEQAYCPPRKGTASGARHKA